mgnify:CR=1 FL=1
MDTPLLHGARRLLWVTVPILCLGLCAGLAPAKADDDGRPLRDAEGRLLGPLQHHDVNEFRMVGAFLAESGPAGLLRTPEGHSRVVEPGTHVGKHWGVVTQITTDYVEVTEEFRSEHLVDRAAVLRQCTTVGTVI